jgi:hypothetical protein
LESTTGAIPWTVDTGARPGVSWAAADAFARESNPFSNRRKTSLAACRKGLPRGRIGIVRAAISMSNRAPLEIRFLLSASNFFLPKRVL